jgi:hypothetical protein
MMLQNPARKKMNGFGTASLTHTSLHSFNSKLRTRKAQVRQKAARPQASAP